MSTRTSHSHSYGESAVHLQFTPKYRREAFSDPIVLKVTIGLLHLVAKELGIDLIAAEGGPDHIHLFIRNWKNYSIPQLANRFKGRTSYEMRKRFPDRLWKFRLGERNEDPMSLGHAIFWENVICEKQGLETRKKY